MEEMTKCKVIADMGRTYKDNSLLEILEDLEELQGKIDVLSKAFDICCGDGYGIDEVKEALEDTSQYAYEVNVYFRHRLAIAK